MVRIAVLFTAGTGDSGLEKEDPPIEYRFTLADGWSRRVFIARYQAVPLPRPATHHGDGAGLQALRGRDAEETLRRMESIDEVHVGPYRGHLSLELLREGRPDAIEHIRWDPLPQLRLVSPRGSARIAWVEAHGTPAGFADT